MIGTFLFFYDTTSAALTLASGLLASGVVAFIGLSRNT